MRDRLIGLLDKVQECGMDRPKDEERYPTLYPSNEQVADHLLANGVIVPPCKVGDMVYIVVNPYSFLPLKKAMEGEVVSIYLHGHGLFLRVLFDTKKINGCADYNLNWRLGKDLFLTRAEAEKALAERMGERDNT